MTPEPNHQRVLIVDFGSQVTQLIARRVREAGVYCEIHPFDKAETVVDEPPVPAVSIRTSVKPDYLVCLEDGKKLKMLKRHLKTRYNMSPEEYRKRWGLADDYPMVAPNYAEQRSSLAKKIGLGTKPRARGRRSVA